MGHYGLGRHAQFVEAKDLLIFLRLLYAVYYVYDIGLFFTKVSALLLLSRIFPWHANAKWFNYTLIATHCLNCAWLAGIIFGTIFMCTPVQKGWGHHIHVHSRPEGLGFFVTWTLRHGPAPLAWKRNSQCHH
ncbi:hypothetical protein N7478_010290 [Penicillium angulare]|uniref:uncharacterized protein n=1 Tax=Penicillium angulare TaxID=116970 RepID=UPI00253F6E19|nr:uncharacterized protein N7478_010290 [Penicillium angulare]KAJ5267482.1 hypothetical protein N7478_010290 [Penicillium angulare]